MSRWVDISFQCVPLRSLTRMTPPLDAMNEIDGAVPKTARGGCRSMDFTIRITCTTGKCVYHLTNRRTDWSVGVPL